MFGFFVVMVFAVVVFFLFVGVLVWFWFVLFCFCCGVFCLWCFWFFFLTKQNKMGNFLSMLTTETDFGARI